MGRLLISDMREGFRLLGRATGPLLLLAFGTVVTLFLLLQSSPYLGSAVLLGLIYGGPFTIVAAGIPLVLIGLILIELFHFSHVRRTAPEIRFRWVPKANLVGCLVVVMVVLLFLSLLLSTGIISLGALIGPALIAGDDLDREQLFLRYGLELMLVLVAMAGVAFVFSRIGLLPVIARHRDVGLAAAWRIGRLYGRVRNRLFRVALLLAIVNPLLGLLLTFIWLKLIHDMRFLVPVSMLQSLLFVGLLVAVMTYLVHAHAPEADRDGAED